MHGGSPGRQENPADDRIAHFRRGDGGCVVGGKVSRAQAGGKRIRHGAFYSVRLNGKPEGMSQHHRNGKNRREWVRDSIAGDVRRTAVDRTDGDSPRQTLVKRAFRATLRSVCPWDWENDIISRWRAATHRFEETTEVKQ